MGTRIYITGRALLCSALIFAHLKSCKNQERACCPLYERALLKIFDGNFWGGWNWSSVMRPKSLSKRKWKTWDRRSNCSKTWENRKYIIKDLEFDERMWKIYVYQNSRSFFSNKCKNSTRFTTIRTREAALRAKHAFRTLSPTCTPCLLCELDDWKNFDDIVCKLETTPMFGWVVGRVVGKFHHPIFQCHSRCFPNFRFVFDLCLK